MAREWTEEQKEAARLREKARRQQQTEETPQMEPNETPVAADPNAALIALIQDLAAQVSNLTSKVNSQAAAQPRFVPMGAPELPNSGSVAAGMKRGDERQGMNQLPISGRGLRLDDNVFRAFEQQFQPGERVLINPDSIRDGSETTWGEIIARTGPFNCPTKIGKMTCRTPLENFNGFCPRCGAGPVIKSVRYLTKRGEWKYIVKVPGLTARQGFGDGFAQSELMPA